MPSMVFSDAGLRSLEPPAKGQQDYWDSTLPGFGVRISQGGAKTFVVNIDKSRRTIGRYPLIKLGEARTEAKRMFAERTLGKIRPQSITYAQAVKLFLDEKRDRRRARTVADHTRHLYKLGFKCQVADVSDADMERKLKRLPPSEFNHRLACAKTFFRWALRKRYRSDDPTIGLTPHKRAKRKRILTDKELKTIWDATAQMTGNFPDIVRLLILMGQRRGETAALLDTFYSDNQQTITLPAEVTKNGRQHTFPAGAHGGQVYWHAISAGSGQAHYSSKRWAPTTRSAVGASARKSSTHSPHTQVDLHDLRRLPRDARQAQGSSRYCRAAR